jgi:hypothetical protein
MSTDTRGPEFDPEGAAECRNEGLLLSAKQKAALARGLKNIF